VRGVSDDRLVAFLVEGNPDAADELYRRYAKGLYVFLAHVMRLPDAEDAVHDVFVRVIRKASQFRPGKAPFRAWLFRIAHNHAVNLFRRRGRIGFTSLDQELRSNRGERGISLKESVADPASGVEGRFLVQAVRECLEGLRKEEERKVLVMYYMLGRNYREIGRVFRKSVNSVRRAAAAGAEKVKRCLEEKGFGSRGTGLEKKAAPIV